MGEGTKAEKRGGRKNLERRGGNENESFRAPAAGDVMGEILPSPLISIMVQRCHHEGRGMRGKGNEVRSTEIKKKGWGEGEDGRGWERRNQC